MTTTEAHQDVATIQATVEAARPHLDAMVALQAGYDDVGWNIQKPLSSKYRHMGYHLRDACNTLDRLTEANEHAELDGYAPTDAELREMVKANGIVVAELLFGVLQLAELGDIDLAGAIRDMWSRNAKNFAPDSPYAELPQEIYTEQLPAH